MANKDIFGLERKKKGSVPDSAMKPVKYRVDPFRVMDGDVERVKRQTQIEKHPLPEPEPMPNNTVEAPAGEVRKKKKEE